MTRFLHSFGRLLGSSLAARRRPRRVQDAPRARQDAPGGAQEATKIDEKSNFEAKTLPRPTWDPFWVDFWWIFGRFLDDLG